MRSKEDEAARPLGGLVGRDCSKCSSPLVWMPRAESKHGARARCKVCMAASDKARYDADPEKRREYSKQYKINNRDVQRRHASEYRKRHPEKVNAAANRARARKMNAETDGLVYPIHLQSRCSWCQSEVPNHVDHIVPLAAGGADIIKNKTGACASCNSSKGARLWPGQPGWSAWLKTRRNNESTFRR